MNKFLLLFVLALMGGSNALAQITGNGHTGTTNTAYTNGSANNTIFIWCGTTLGAQQGSLTATPNAGTGPYTFNWFFHNETNASWQFLSSSNGATSTINGLASDGYRVEIRDVNNIVVNCFIAWVWNLNTEVTAANTRTGCNSVNLTSTVSTSGSFSYFNPPPPESLITAATNIQVCLTANHTYVSDLAFYLIGPASCGSPVVLLTPNPGAIGEGAVCNGGNNVDNLCFTTTPAANLSVCAPAPVPLTGVYSSYGAAGIPINWGGLIGCNAASGGWRVQIFDCIAADVGALTNASITFSNLNSLCGSPTVINYTSGAINSAINDNSCNAAIASIFQVPPPAGLTTPITLNATTTLQWTSVPASAITNSTLVNAAASGIPEGTTTFTQTATTTFGGVTCTSPASTGFTYARPVVSAGPAQTVCNGGNVTLSGSGATTYTWNNGVANNVAFTPPAGTTTYTVTGTDAAGCQNTATTTVTVGATPVITVNSPTICAGGTATLTATGASTYSWSPATALSATVGASVDASPGVTTIYTITGTDAAGCTGTNTATVTIGPNPVITVNSPSVCDGTTAVLTASGATTYSWSPAAGLSATVGATVNANVAVNTNFTVTGTIGGCTGTAVASVTILPLPVVTVNSPAICAGATATLTAAGAATYSWSPATGLSATVGNTVNASPAATTIYTITGTSAAGCVANGTSTVTINANPVVTVNSAAICQGGSATLTAIGASSYSWSPATGLSATNLDAVSASPAATTIYTVTGTNADGCTATANSTLTVNTNPTVAVNSPTICQGGSAALSASGAATYSWSADPSLSSLTGANVTATPASSTSYTVTGTSVDGCTGTAVSTVTVNLNPLPVVASAAICAGGTATLTATGASSYSWSPATGLSATNTPSVNANPAVTTIYTITGTTLGCTGTTTATLTVHPNPVMTVNSPTICDGSTIALTATGADTYAWSPATALSATTGTTVNANPSATTVYTITGTSTDGCTSTINSTLTVNPIPTLTLTNNGPVCDGDALSFTATGPAGSVYAWTGPQSFNSAVQNPVIGSAGLAADGTYTCTVTSLGCSFTQTTTAVVNPIITPVITAAGPFCINDAPVVLSASIPGGTWSGTGITDPATGAFTPTEGVSAISYAVPGACTAPGVTSITTFALPDVQFSAPLLSDCAPFTAVINNDSPGTPSSVTWDFGDGSTASDLATTTHTFDAPGCYTITLTATENGCVNSLILPNYICANAWADADFDVQDPEQTTTYPFFQTTNNSDNATSYFWDFSDGATATTTNAEHMYPEKPGTYEIMLVANNAANCPDTAYRTVVVIEDLIYYVPNTFTPDGDAYNNMFTPVFNSGFDPFSYTFLIFDRWGEVLFESHNVTEGWDGSYAAGYAKEGVYTWTIQFKGSGSDKKFTNSGSVTLIR